jgi:hypothetical protein
MVGSYGILDLPEFVQSGPEMKKPNEVKDTLIPVKSDAVRHFSVRYRTGTMDA